MFSKVRLTMNRTGQSDVFYSIFVVVCFFPSLSSNCLLLWIDPCKQGQYVYIYSKNWFSGSVIYIIV